MQNRYGCFSLGHVLIMDMAHFFGVVPDATWNTLRAPSQRLLRAGVMCMVLAIGCHIWDQYDARSDQPVTAEITDCTVVSSVEQPLVRVTVDQKTYLVRPRAGVLKKSKCRVGDRLTLYHPPASPTDLRRLRQVILAVPALMASLLGFLLLFIVLYLHIWPIWTSGDWERAPHRIRWLRFVPLQWLSLLALPLAYPLAIWMRG